MSHSRLDNSTSPFREEVRDTANEDVRVSGVLNRDNSVRRGSIDKNKATPPKAVKFMQGGEISKPRDPSPEFNQGAGAYGAGSVKVPAKSEANIAGNYSTGATGPGSMKIPAKAESNIAIKDLGGSQNKGVQKLSFGKVSKPEPAAVTKQADVFKADDMDFEDLDDF